MNIRDGLLGWIHENLVGALLGILVVVTMSGVMIFGHLQALHNKAEVARGVEDGTIGSFTVREKANLPDGSRAFEVAIRIDDRVLKRFDLNDNARAASDRYGRAFSKQLEAALVELLRTHPGCALRSSSVVSSRIEERGGCLSSSTITLPSGAHVILACPASPKP